MFGGTRTVFADRPVSSVDLKTADIPSEANKSPLLVQWNGEPIIAERQYSVSVGGGQPDAGAPTIAGKFREKGTKELPK